MTKAKVVKITGANVLIRQHTEQVTKSGIYMPDEALKGGSCEIYAGTILAIGELCDKFSPGQYVAFGRNSMAIKKWDGEEFLILHEGALVASESFQDESYECNTNEYIVSVGNDPDKEFLKAQEKSVELEKKIKEREEAQENKRKERVKELLKNKRDIAEMLENCKEIEKINLVKT